MKYLVSNESSVYMYLLTNTCVLNFEFRFRKSSSIYNFRKIRIVKVTEPCFSHMEFSVEEFSFVAFIFSTNFLFNYFFFHSKICIRYSCDTLIHISCIRVVNMFSVTSDFIRGFFSNSILNFLSKNLCNIPIVTMQKLCQLIEQM